MRFILITLLLTAVGLSLFLSGYFSRAAKVYVKPIANPILTLDPRMTRDRTSYMIARSIFGQLIAYDSFGNIQPGIFETWQVKENGQKYLFVIRKNAKFHDGIEITARDAAFSFRYLAAKDSLVSRYFANIDGYQEYIKGSSPTINGIKVVSKYELEIRLTRPSYIFLAQLADPKIVLLPEELRSLSPERFFNHPIGAGAYKLKTMSSDRAEIVLERFTDYYGTQSNIDVVKLTAVEKDEAIEAFKRGDLHDLEAFMLNKSEIESLKSVAKVVSISSHSINLLFFNGRRRILQDLAIREELANAITVSNLPQECDLNVRPANGVIPHGILGFNDLRSARVSKSVSDKRVRTQFAQPERQIRILAYGTPPSPCLLEKITSGINNHSSFKAEVIFLSEADAMEVFLSGEYELLFDNLSVRGPEPFNLFTFFDSRSPHDLIFFHDSYISRRLVEIESMIGGQRAFAYAGLSQYIANEKHYAIPLFTDIRVFVFSKSVNSDGIPATLMGNMPFERVRL